MKTELIESLNETLDELFYELNSHKIRLDKPVQLSKGIVTHFYRGSGDNFVGNTCNCLNFEWLNEEDLEILNSLASLNLNRQQFNYNYIY